MQLSHLSLACAYAQAGQLEESHLYEALSLQQGLPVVDPDVGQVSRQIARTLERLTLDRTEGLTVLSPLAPDARSPLLDLQPDTVLLEYRIA